MNVGYIIRFVYSAAAGLSSSIFIRKMEEDNPLNLACPVGPEDPTGINPVIYFKSDLHILLWIVPHIRFAPGLVPETSGGKAGGQRYFQ